MTSKQLWTLSFIPKANKEFQKLSKPTQRRIEKYMDKVIASEDPRSFGKPLEDTLKGKWRYRVGDYRLICEIKDNKLLILVVKVKHRSKAYATH